MTAEITLDSSLYDIIALGKAAGQPDVSKISHFAGILYVEDITQTDLDNAFAIAPTIDPIDTEKMGAKQVIDRVAGNIRNKYLTTVPGQAMTYLKKETDAEAFKAAGYPEGSISDYPWIQAEANAQADLGQQVADAILAQRDAWIIIGASIEEERIKGKVQVEQQLSSDGIIVARDLAITALELI